MIFSPSKLELRVHIRNGDALTFVQTGRDKIRKILEEFQPQVLFYAEEIDLEAWNSTISISVSSITRPDLIPDDNSRLVFPSGVVEAVELTENEFHALIRSPAIRRQWEQFSAGGVSIV